MSSPGTPSTNLYFGRGGAGNIVSSDPEGARRPSHASDSFTSRQAQTSRRFSTGIGGAGNIARNDPDKSEEMRALLDASTPGLVLSSTPASHHGRGGSANTYTTSDEDVKAARENNERVRRASQASRNRGENLQEERAGSLTQSLRDFITRRNSKEN